MVDDSEGDGNARDTFVDADDDSTTEPEIHRWLQIYAEASDDSRDAAVAAIFDEVNCLLRRYRRESGLHRADYGSRLRTLTEQMPVMLWTTDTRLRVTTVAGDGQAAVDIDPSSTASLPLSVVLGTDTQGPGAVEAHERALRGEPGVFEYDRRSRSYLAHVQPLAAPDGDVAGTIGVAIDVTERKLAEAALARRERQLADAQRLAQVGSWEFDFATNRLSWSEEEYRIFGLRPELGPPSREAILARIHPDDRERSVGVWESAIRTGEPYAWDYRIVRPDGEVRVIHGRGAAERDATGRAERIVGTSQDITELRHAVEAARATKRMLEHLLDCFPNGAIGVLDTELRYVLAAGRSLTEVGLTPDLMVGRALAEVHPPEAATARAGPYRRALAGETVTVDVPFADRSYTLSVAPLDRVDGAVQTIVSVSQDITERVRAERALARREAQLAEAQHLAQLGSWERDIASGRLTWSDELYRIYGLEPQEIPASFEAFMAHVHPEDAARVRAINEAAVRSGEPFECQARILRPDGEVRYYHSRGTLLRDSSGGPGRLVGVVQDATERVRAEEARALQRERQARLDGMLFAVRELATRVTRSLAAAPEAGDGPGPGTIAPSSRDEAFDAVTELSRMVDEIAQIRHLMSLE
jgi:PAS domain S-box-containing protein